MSENELANMCIWREGLVDSQFRTEFVEKGVERGLRMKTVE